MTAHQRKLKTMTMHVKEMTAHQRKTVLMKMTLVKTRTLLMKMTKKLTISQTPMMTMVSLRCLQLVMTTDQTKTKTQTGESLTLSVALEKVLSKADKT